MALTAKKVEAELVMFKHAQVHNTLYFGAHWLSVFILESACDTFVQIVTNVIGHRDISADWLSVGPTTNCEQKCIENREFTCEAFTWSKPSGPCYLHGQINRAIIRVPSSQFGLFERNCSKSKGVSYYCV